MSLLDKLSAAFESLNETLDTKILEKCEELCIAYNIDPEDFIDQWLAYTASNLNGAPPSIEHLEKMERRELQKQAKMAPRTPKTSRIVPMEVSPIKPKDVSLNTQFSTQDFDTPSKKFTLRENSKAVLLEFGSTSDFKSSNVDLDVEVLNNEISESRYMLENFSLRRQALNSIGLRVINKILSHYNLQLTIIKMSDFGNDIIIGGRIYSNSKLNEFYLEGTLDIYKGKKFTLNMDNIENFSLFNSQVVVFKGLNTPTHFVVKEIYQIPHQIRELKLVKDIHIVVATGPFTMPENNLYEPLADLLKYITETEPDVVVLLGPFLDSQQPGTIQINEEYDSFFNSIINELIKKIENLRTKVILIPSDRDIHHHPIYPNTTYMKSILSPKVIFAPNPALLNIGGLIIGATSIDVLFHLSNIQLTKGQQSVNRISQLISHLLEQGSFYPLQPPQMGLAVDYRLLEKFAMWDQTPHLLFVPSNFKYFVRNVENCIVVNPERLVKGSNAGTFARLLVKAEGRRLDEKITCQILRV